MGPHSVAKLIPALPRRLQPRYGGVSDELMSSMGAAYGAGSSSKPNAIQVYIYIYNRCNRCNRYSNHITHIRIDHS